MLWLKRTRGWGYIYVGGTSSWNSILPTAERARVNSEYIKRLLLLNSAERDTTRSKVVISVNIFQNELIVVQNLFQEFSYSY